MNKIIFYLFLLLLALLFSSTACKELYGLCDDPIKLSQETVQFDSSSNTITITSNSKDWWLNNVFLNKTYVEFKDLDESAKNFVAKGDEFQIERKNGNTIIISMNENITDSERVLSVSLQAGNCFSQINLTQSKK